jgi:TPP-dependent pyruvate/acetoin dehydrogenase alpha subunit
MKRYKAYDPPEYVEWELDPDELDRFGATVAADPARKAIIDALDEEALLDMYAALVRARLHDIHLKRWVKNGVITKAWLATGEEAVTVGSTLALDRRGGDGDVVGPMIRNASACLEMGIPLEQMFGAYLAVDTTPCRGRDLHIGDLAHGVVAPVSHVGSLMPVMVGCALGFKMKREPRVAMTWVGDGASKNGEFHEGVNFAAAVGLPVVTFIQNNQVALGTPTTWHHKGEFPAFADAYGMPGAVVDGNNLLDVYAASKIAVDRARAGNGPTLLVAETFRMGGHATHDEREAREIFPAELFAQWGKRDPVGLFEAWLEARGIAQSTLSAIEADVDATLEAAAASALAQRASAQPDPNDLLVGIYA